MMKEYIKTEFNSDDDLPLYKTLNLVMVVRTPFMKATNITHKFFQMNVYSNQLKNSNKQFFWLYNMLRFDKTKVAKKKLHDAKNQ